MEEELDPKFEIVGLYPIYGIKGAKLVMSAHIYVVDWDLDIRGFVVHHHAFPIADNPNQQRIAYPPQGRNWDYEEKKLVVFPLISSIRGKWLEKVKEALIKAGEEKFKIFVFPENFPRSYFDYLEMGKDKQKVRLRPDRDPSKMKQKRPFKKFTQKKAFQKR